MAVLTENIVLCRTRAQDLNNVRKLNCWGSEISDVSIVRRMPNVEVLSLSVNDITTLIDFAYCQNLQELYLRKNKITDLNEVCYLQVLPNLHSFWLAENPCAEGKLYRLTVLRALPNLEKLDNILVQPDEVERAKIQGLQLTPPRPLFQDVSPESPHYSPVQALIQDSGVQDTEQQYAQVQSPGECIQERPSSQQESPRDSVHGEFQFRSKDPVPDMDGRADTTGMKCHHQEQRPRSIILFEEEERSNLVMTTSVESQGGVTPSFGTPLPQPPHQHVFHARVQTLVDHSGRRIRKNADVNCEMIGCDAILEDQSGIVTRRSSMSDSQSSVSDVHHAYFSDPDGAASSGDGYGLPVEEHRHVQSNIYYHTENKTTEQKSGSPGRILPKGGKNRNSNILSAVLCLIKELDYASLEVVETAIHCRMEEMDD